MTGDTMNVGAQKLSWQMDKTLGYRFAGTKRVAAILALIVDDNGGEGMISFHGKHELLDREPNAGLLYASLVAALTSGQPGAIGELIDVCAKYVRDDEGGQ